MKNEIFLWIDDIRDPDYSKVPANIPIFAISRFDQAIRTIDLAIAAENFIYIDFDHDLQSKKTGYDIAKHIVESQYKDIKYNIHSMNPVGRKNIDDLLSHYGYKTF